MNERDQVRAHSFDGIQEYDNDLPNWWVWLFVITVVFACVYPFYYDFGPGEFASESVDREVAAYKEAANRAQAVSGEDVEAKLKTLITDGTALAAGKDIFMTRCLPCHGDKGQGLIGPNLTDDNWIHGGTLKEIRNTVNNGVIQKGMIAWKDQLSPDQINNVVAYIWNLNGTNPPNAKAPEGEKVVR